MKSELKEIINSDLFRMGGNTSRKSLFINQLLNPAFKFICIHRKCNFYRDRNKIKYLFYRAKLYRLNINMVLKYLMKLKLDKDSK